MLIPNIVFFIPLFSKWVTELEETPKSTKGWSKYGIAFSSRSSLSNIRFFILEKRILERSDKFTKLYIGSRGWLYQVTAHSLPVQRLRAVESSSLEIPSKGQEVVCHVTGSSPEEPPAHCQRRLWILPDFTKKLDIFRDQNLPMLVRT